MAPLVLRPCSAYHQQRANHVAYRLVLLTVSENGETVLDNKAVTNELLEEQSIHLLSRDYIDLIG